MSAKQFYAAVVTPFLEDGGLDLISARRAYTWLLEQGATGFMLFGSMGEGPQLTAAMRLELAAAGMEAAAGRGKVLFCLQGAGEKLLREQMDQLADFKHDAWALPLPGGAGRPADPVAFVHRLADASDRPLFFYNLPTANGIVLSLAEWRDLLDHPKVAGVKNSAGQMRVRKELQRLRNERDFTLLEGDEWAIDEALAMGHDGMLVGMGLLGARLLVLLARAADDGDWDQARRVQMDLITSFHAFYGEDVATFCSGQKYALTRLGLFKTATALVDNQRALPEAARRRIDAFLDEHQDWFPPLA